MSATNIAINAILSKEFFGSGTLGNWQVGLSRVVIAPDGTGADEPSVVDGYHRITIARGTDIWTQASNSTISNVFDYSFPEATSTWGTIRAIFLANTGGIWFYHNINPPVFVGANTILRFPAGSIVTQTGEG